MMDFYEKVKSILCMDLPASMMHVTAKNPRFWNCYDSASVADGYQRNAMAENHGTNDIGEFEDPVSGSPANLPGHENFPESVVGNVIFPREGSMNICSVMETQGIEHDRDRVDFYNEAEGSVPAEPDSYTHVKAPYNSQNLDQFSVDDQEN